MSDLVCECGQAFRSHVKIGSNLVAVTECPQCGKPISAGSTPSDSVNDAAGRTEVYDQQPEVADATSVEQALIAENAAGNFDFSAARSSASDDSDPQHSSKAIETPKLRRLSTAYGGSLMLHLVIGMLLAAFIVPTVLKPWEEYLICELAMPESTALPEAFTDDVGANLAEETLGMNPITVDPEFNAARLAGAVSANAGGGDSPGDDPAIEIAAVNIKPTFDRAVSKNQRTNLKASSSGKKQPVSQLLQTALRDGKRFNHPLLKSVDEGMMITSDSESAAKGVFSQLAGGGGGGSHQWHIWLLDASISLQAERQKLGDDVAEFYRTVVKKDSGTPLDVSVVAFGEHSQSILDKTSLIRGEAGKLVASRIKDLPLDESGIENVMTAVADSIRLVPPNLKAKISIVVWTDESGDDIEKLEETIALCRMSNTAVHIVGPRSVFGMQPGLQRHTLPPPLSWELVLPVTRGPDSAFPERVRLPLWYDSTDMPWSAGIPIPSSIDAQGLGGPLRCGLLAPTGPYALTRLALATGGTYTILDRHGDAPPPHSEGLLRYAPDYRGARDIAMDLELHPLRRAVVEAAALTWTQDFWPPQREFPVSRHNYYPFKPYHTYMTPIQFIQVMTVRLQQDRARLAEAAVTLEQALNLLESVPSAAKALEHESPRWKAWYILNRGLLAAHSVRISEFLRITEPLMTQEVQLEIVNNEVNHLMLAESDTLPPEVPLIRRAKLARMLLEQVIRDHPDTPWSQLAKWELQHQPGFSVVFGKIPIPTNFVVPPPAQHTTLPRL